MCKAQDTVDSVELEHGMQSIGFANVVKWVRAYTALDWLERVFVNIHELGGRDPAQSIEHQLAFSVDEK